MRRVVDVGRLDAIGEAPRIGSDELEDLLTPRMVAAAVDDERRDREPPAAVAPAHHLQGFGKTMPRVSGRHRGVDVEAPHRREVNVDGHLHIRTGQARVGEGTPKRREVPDPFIWHRPGDGR
jgi:hypothetical protein